MAILIARDDTQFDKIKTNVLRGLETPGFDWPPEEDADTQRDELEALVKHLRATRDDRTRFVDAVALRTIALPQNLGKQILDVLGRPSSPLSKLVSNESISFRGISNEIARSRLSDCYFLRKNSSDLTGIAQCAGFSLPRQDLLAECLNGGRCTPQWSDTAYRLVSVINKPTTLKELLTNNDFPRVFNGALGEDINALNRCRSDGSKSTEMCILAATLPNETRRIWQDCMQAGNEKNAKDYDMCCVNEQTTTR